MLIFEVWLTFWYKWRCENRLVHTNRLVSVWFHQSVVVVCSLVLLNGYLPVGKESPRLNCGRGGSSAKIRLALPPGISVGSSSSAGRFNAGVGKFC